jgi:hypothetical protein
MSDPKQVKPSSPTIDSVWKRWHILVAFPGRPLRHISETVTARSKEEAERKAGKFLSGRGTIIYKVCLPNDIITYPNEPQEK